MPANFNNNQGNMSLDGGYIGSIDHAISNLKTGQKIGHQQGLEEGYQQGYQEGEQAGWNSAIEKANEELRKQLDFTRESVTENEKLKAENEELRKQLQERTKQYSDSILLRNQTVIFVNTARDVLENIIQHESPSVANRLKKLFSEKYKSYLKRSIEKKFILQKPEQSTAFAQEMPQTHRFLITIVDDADESINDRSFSL